jgi:hypothetical protein
LWSEQAALPGSPQKEAAPREAGPLEGQPGAPHNRTGEFCLQLVRGGSISVLQSPADRHAALVNAHSRPETTPANILLQTTTEPRSRK